MSTTGMYIAYVMLYDAVRNIPGDSVNFWRMLVNYCSTDFESMAYIFVPMRDKSAGDIVDEIHNLTDKTEILSRLVAAKKRFSYTKKFI